jgi:hypothetical protein
MDKNEPTGGIADHIAFLKSNEKQYEDRIYEEPPRPTFFGDEPEEETIAPDEVIEDVQEDDPQLVEMAGDAESDFYASGFLGVMTFGIERLLAAMNEEDPESEEYQLDKHEEKHLRKSAALLFKSKNIKARPGTWFIITLVIIYGRKLATGIAHTSRRLFNWFKGRKAKREAEANQKSEQEALRQAALEAEARQAEAAIYEQQMREKVRKEVYEEILHQKAAEAKPEPTARQGKTQASAQDPEKPSKVETLMLQLAKMKAPTLQQQTQRAKDHICLNPVCNEAVREGHMFHDNNCRIAYSGMVQRKGSNWPSSKKIQQAL